jgi:hypothetical protein
MKSKYFFILLIFFVASCTDSEDAKKIRIEQMILDNVEQRIQEYIAIRERNCKEDILVEAGKRADSLLLEEARNNRLSDLRISIPDKPATPIKAFPQDFNLLKEKLDSIKPIINHLL